MTKPDDGARSARWKERGRDRGGRAGPCGPRSVTRPGVLKQRCDVLWLPFQRVALAVVLRTDYRGAKASAGRPV